MGLEEKIDAFEQGVLKGQMTLEEFEQTKLTDAVFCYYSLKQSTDAFRQAYEKLAEQTSPLRQKRKNNLNKAVRLLNAADNLMAEHEFHVISFCDKGIVADWQTLVEDENKVMLSNAYYLDEYSKATGRTPEDVLAPYPYEMFEQWQQYVAQGGKVDTFDFGNQVYYQNGVSNIIPFEHGISSDAPRMSK